MEQPDDLLEEPLYIDGTFIRSWADLARLTPPEAGAPIRRARWRDVRADVPAPRPGLPADPVVDPYGG
ncbi:hypothetical protein DQ239_19865 [Blastococcus sp. TF02-09]|uniref:hypothetical protein n=1 Tax=Blastococcus sp. TF02-09 TaxID=2250576 RepID=UPI000DE873A1|nr:hypothetical protein [Blastococcus sp. TF02-9]RBY74427.1 hypothetical protein DQ239_19865 [Blastococcus sp. TF02-9]